MSRLFKANGSRWLLIGAAISLLFQPSLSYSMGRELEIKAAYVFRLALFVEWPVDYWVQADVINICIFDDPPFNAVARRVIGSEQINHKPVNVRFLESARALTQCHIIYLPKHTRQMSEILGHLAERPVLTIGESKEFYAQGGMIFLFQENERLRFAINQERVERSGLKIRAQLLKLVSQPEAE